MTCTKGPDVKVYWGEGDKKNRGTVLTSLLLTFLRSVLFQELRHLIGH